MFNKKGEKLKSFLGSESEFQGELAAKGILRIDGTVTGKIRADQVILSETSFIRGEITAKKIIVGGKVEGVLKGETLVEITSKGKVKGEIFTSRFLVMEGGELNGHIEMKTDESKIIDFESKNEAFSH